MVQAVGGGATVPISMAVATTVLPASQRGMAIGLVVASAEAGSLLGPAYGGAIIELLSWRWIFWLNAPQAALIMAALVWLPSRRQPDAKVDWQGGILLAGVLFVLTFALSREGLFTLTSLEPFLVGAPGLALVGVLALVERRKYQPLLEPALLRTRAFITANATQLLEGVSLIIAMVTIPLMANTVMERDPLTGGWWLAAPDGGLGGGGAAGGLAAELHRQPGHRYIRPADQRHWPDTSQHMAIGHRRTVADDPPVHCRSGLWVEQHAPHGPRPQLGG